MFAPRALVCVAGSHSDRGREPTVRMRSSRTAEPLPLGYATHSGSGVQLQALTAAVFLANATGRPLNVPPWLIHRDMPAKLWDPRSGTVTRGCKRTYVDPSKHDISSLSDAVLCKLCRSDNHLDSFSSVFALDELVRPLPTLTKERCRACSSGSSGRRASAVLCDRVDLDPHFLHLARNDPNRLRWPWSNTGNSTTKPDCSQTLTHLRASTHACERLLHAVSDAASLLDASKRPALCVGPLNDWLFESPFGHESTLIGRCSRSHPVAERLSRAGLPLRQAVVALLPRLFPRPCGACVYVRLPDRRKDLSSLHDALFSRDGRRLLTVLGRALGQTVDDGGVELVSSCVSSECRNPLSHASGSTWYARTENATKEMLRRVGPRMLAPVAHGEQMRAALDALQGLGLGIENARILYDQLRCARCRAVRGMAGASNRDHRLKGMAGFRETSSFYKAIERFNHQLLDRGVTPRGAEIPGLAGLAPPRPRKEPTWKCSADGTKCKVYTY